MDVPVLHFKSCWTPPIKRECSAAFWKKESEYLNKEYSADNLINEIERMKDELNPKTEKQKQIIEKLIDIFEETDKEVKKAKEQRFKKGKTKETLIEILQEPEKERVKNIRKEISQLRKEIQVLKNEDLKYYEKPEYQKKISRIEELRKEYLYGDSQYVNLVKKFRADLDRIGIERLQIV